jgi:hypothetical protein
MNKIIGFFFAIFAMILSGCVTGGSLSGTTGESLSGMTGESLSMTAAGSPVDSAGAPVSVIVIDNIQYREDAVRALGTARAEFHAALEDNRRKDIEKIIGDKIAVLHAGGMEFDTAAFDDKALSALITAYYETLLAADQLYRTDLNKNIVPKNQGNTVAATGTWDDFFPPVKPEIVSIEGRLFDAYSVTAIRRHMARSSDTLWAAIGADITETITAQYNQRMANVDSFLDYNYNWLVDNYVKVFRTLTGTSEEWMQSKFVEFIEAGIDESALVNKIAVYDQQLSVSFGVFYLLLTECAVPDDTAEIYTAEQEMSFEECFSPFLVLQKMRELESSLGIEIISPVWANSGLGSKVLHAISPLFFTKEIVDKIKIALIPGKAAAKKLGQKIAAGAVQSTIFKSLIAKLGASTAARAGAGAAAKAGAGIAGGLIGGPAGVIIGVGGVIAVEAIISFSSTKLDELFNRKKLKAEIEAVILADKNNIFAILN